MQKISFVVNNILYRTRIKKISWRSTERNISTSWFHSDTFVGRTPAPRAVLWLWIRGKTSPGRCQTPDNCVPTMSSDNNALSAEVVLGFLEEAEPWRLLSTQFPSKVGGKPAWLSQKGLPSLPELQCEKCRLPMAFLLQVSGVMYGRRRLSKINSV